MSRPVTVSISHRLGRAEARRRIEAGFTETQRRLNERGGFLGRFSSLRLERRWENDRMVFHGGALGQRVDGDVEVLDEAVVVRVWLPELLAAGAEKLRCRLTEEGQRLLGNP